MWGQRWGAALREPFLVGPWASADTSLAVLLRITGCDGANEQAWPWVTVPLAALRVLVARRRTAWVQDRHLVSGSGGCAA